MRSTFPATAYTVGWICVKVENEAVAARAMLDERHGYIDLSGQGDPIQYFGGRIGKHNVIIGCSGEAGLYPANNVATYMSSSFKNIKVGLLCGIGGGNPSEKHDIRLGDVVVGMPGDQHSGVTQYNAGKTTEDGFLRKRSHNRPPQFLIQAVGSRRTDLIEGLDTWEKYLDSAPKDWGSFDNLTDILHEGQRNLPRPSNRGPKVHYGLIASGDLVVKADKSRRELVQQIQDDVLCFEMEAAGLVNTFPCLVVRGISDYCDRYKNDDWQPYASCAAAAYCKYLLEVVHVSDVQVAATAAEIMRSDTHQVPFSLKGVPVVDHFVPRVKDMQKLESFFFTEEADLTRRKMFVVHGLGGIGKTQLCIEFIRRHQEKYSAVFWLDGSSEDALRRSFTDVVTRLPAAEVPLALTQAAEQASPDYRSMVQGVLDWLSLPFNRRWLLVIDNVDRDHTAIVKDPSAYDVKQYLPAADHGNMLVTSRLSTLTAARNSLRLTEVDRDQARAILDAIGGEIMLDIAQDNHSVNALLDRLSGLPLALTQAAAYIGQTAVSINQYLEYYDTMWKDLMEQQNKYPLQEYAERSVLTTWRLSYEQVKKQSEEASNLLQLWSFLYAGDLWFELVAHIKKLDESAMSDWLIVLAQDMLQFDRALALLIKYSLVEGNTETASYAMHSVLHSWCRYLGNSEAERDFFRKLAVDVVGSTVPWTIRKKDWILLRRLLPHGQVILTGMKSDTEAETDLNVIWAYDSLAWMFRVQDRYAEAERLLERALAGSEKALGPEHTDTLGIIHNLGRLYCKQGRLVEAEELFERALSGSEKVLGSEHTSTLDTVYNLGILYREQGKLVEAEAMYERALAGSEKALGPEHTSTLDIVNSLGLLYYDQGRLVEAGAMYERALAGKEQALGPEHTSTLDTVYNLGRLYRKQGRLAEAEAMYERALAGHEKVFGPEHRLTIEVAGCLSTLRDLSTKSACLDDDADNKATVSKCSNGRLSHDTTLLSAPPTTPGQISRVEQEKHRPRKRDAFFKKLGLR